MISLKKIVLGEEVYIASESNYRKALMVGVAAIIMVSVCLFNWSLNTIIWGYAILSPIFITGILGGMAVYITNRSGYYETAKHLILIVALAMLFVFMVSSGKYYGAQLYLFDVIVASIFLFGLKRAYFWIVYGLLALSCFIVTEVNLIFPITIEDIDSAKENYIYFMNFIFSFLIVVVVIYFQIKLQDRSEKDLKEKDRKLKESEERFRLAVEGTNAGIWDWENINKDQQWWSPKLYELLGYEPDEIAPNKITFKNLLAERADYPRLVKDFQNHLQKKEPFSVEYKFKCKDGSYKWFQGSGQAKWAEGEKPLRMVGSLVDITEKKEWEEQIQEKNSLLEKTNAELDRFVYSVSHDLRAPLNSIQGLINICDTTDDANELKQLMNMMKTRVKKLYTFIDEIISFARNTRTEIQREEVKLFDLASEVVNNAQYREQAATIDFRIDIDESDEIFTDASRLNIVLNNLVDNAIKYHRHNQRGKYIAVNGKSLGKTYKIEVSDNGQGIPDQAQSKIFDMFFRASDNSIGSGLGLFIVKDMVERIGGSIRLDSKLGEGTTFTIELPKE